MGALRIASVVVVFVACTSACGSDSGTSGGGTGGKTTGGTGGKATGGTSSGGTSTGGTSAGGTTSGGAGGTSAGGSGGSATGGTDAGVCSGSWTGNPTCDSCLGTNCCPEITTCAANDQCSQLVQCIQQHCSGPDAGDLLTCASANCSQFSGGIQDALAIQTCQKNSCPTQCTF